MQYVFFDGKLPTISGQERARELVADMFFSSNHVSIVEPGFLSYLYGHFSLESCSIIFENFLITLSLSPNIVIFREPQLVI